MNDAAYRGRDSAGGGNVPVAGRAGRADVTRGLGRDCRRDGIDRQGRGIACCARARLRGRNHAGGIVIGVDRVAAHKHINSAVRARRQRAVRQSDGACPCDCSYIAAAGVCDGRGIHDNQIGWHVIRKRNPRQRVRVRHIRIRNGKGQRGGRPLVHGGGTERFGNRGRFADIEQHACVVAVVVGGGKVGLAIQIEIVHDDRVGIRSGTIIDGGRVKSAVSVVEPHREIAAGTVCHDEVGLAVAVEIPRCHRHWIRARAIIDGGGKRRRRRAGRGRVEQHAHIVGVIVDNRQVGLAVQIEIAYCDRGRTRACRKRGGGGKRWRRRAGGSCVEQHADVIAASGVPDIGNREVGLAVQIEIAHRNPGGSIARSKIHLGIERAIALALQHAHRACVARVSSVGNGNVELAIGVEISYRRPLGTDAHTIGSGGGKGAVPVVQQHTHGLAIVIYDS